MYVFGRDSIVRGLMSIAFLAELACLPATMHSGSSGVGAMRMPDRLARTGSGWASVMELDQDDWLSVRLLRSPPELPVYESQAREATEVGTSVAREYEGSLVSVDQERLVMAVEDPWIGHVTIPRVAIRSVDLIEESADESLVDGFLYGLGSGVAAIAIVAILGGPGEVGVQYWAPIFIGVPTAIGVGVDAARKDKETLRVYEAAE